MGDRATGAIRGVSRPGSRSAATTGAAVLVTAVALMLPGVWGHSVTVVEFAHLPAGLAAWQRHSLGIYRVCGPLSKLLYALPAHLAGVRVDYPASFDADVETRQEWAVGHLFQERNRGRYHAIYRWSRLTPVLLTVLGGCLIWEWSTRLFGAWPGVASLCLWCWLPPVLGHGSLVTSDVAAAVTLLLAARTFWAFLLRPCSTTALLAGAALGLAQATKFTLLVLDPCWGFLLVGRALQLRGERPGDPACRRGSPVRLLTLGGTLLLVSILVIDAAYGFQEVGFKLSAWQSGRSSLSHDLHQLGEAGATAWLLHVPWPIPLELLRGLDVQLADTEQLQSAYLLGQTRLGGWWYWYAVAALLKVPLPVLAVFALALWRLPGASRGPDRVLWASLCLVTPSLVVALTVTATTGTGTNAAFRYLIPSMALLCVWAGRAWYARSKVGRTGMIGLLAWLLMNALLRLPDHLGWQNEIARAWESWSGRPALIGDSLDWGQDLARLSTWLARHSREGDALVCVYGLGDGEPYGLTLPAARSTAGTGEPPAYLAVSANILHGYQSGLRIRIANTDSYIDFDKLKSAVGSRPFRRVGRTIHVYRLCDLLPDPGSTGERHFHK